MRRQWNIPRFEPPVTLPEGELLTVKQAAAVLGTATSTIHRWLNDGFIVGEQLTPGAPWRIRLTEDLRAGFVKEAPQGYLTMYQAMRCLDVSRQTVLQRVKRGELDVDLRNPWQELAYRLPTCDPALSPQSPDEAAILSALTAVRD